MRFPVDESTGAAVVAYLRRVGHDVLAVAEAMLQAQDPDILARVAAEDRILITNDKGFGELVFRNGQLHSGIVLFRLQDESSANRVHTIQAVLERYADRLAGCFTVATDSGVRIRRVQDIV